MPGSDHSRSNHTGDQAQALLRAGNQRFMAQSPEHTHTPAELLAETARGQAPIAAVLGCADSRVPVELIFDRGVGDLFVVRVAGNSATPATIGSIEYAVAELGVPIVVVLGHTGCGAVSAALGSGDLPGNLPAVVEPIGPACEQARAADPGSDGQELIDHTVAINAKHQAGVLLKTSEIVRTAVGDETLRVVAAVYDLKTGEVRWT